jgi:hypothetical protein
MTGTWTTPIDWDRPAPNYLLHGDLNEQVSGNLNFLKTHIALEEADALTIAAGVITVSESGHIKIAGEDDLDDELDTIGGGSEGMVILIRPDGAAITLMNGTGNLVLGTDIILATDTSYFMLVFDGTNWILPQPPNKTRHAKAMQVLDLSGAPAVSVILHPTQDCTLTKLTFLYTEASSADAGILVTVGKESDLDYYYTGTSETNKAQWYEKECDSLESDIAAGDTVLVSSAGSKVGTGEILACIEYEVSG